MDELSWRAKLLKANINITHVDPDAGVVYFDFAYRPVSGGSQRWGKTFHKGVIHYPGANSEVNWEATAELVRDAVLELRKELEG